MIDFLSDLPIIRDYVEHRPKVAVVRMSGVIADAQMHKKGISYARLVEAIEKAFEINEVREVALVINSPGGAPAQCALIASAIRQCAHAKKVPVSAFVEDVAASGGYWLACAADKIYVQASSIVGSVGVISAGFGLDGLIERYGVERRVYSAGKDKAMLDAFLPEKPEDVARIAKIQKEIHGQFIAWVKERRGKRLKGEDADLFEGAIWTGASAVPLGIVDALGDMRGIMHEKYGEKVRFIECEPDVPFFQSLIGVRSASVLGDDFLAAIEARLSWKRFGL